MNQKASFASVGYSVIRVSKPTHVRLMKIKNKRQKELKRLVSLNEIILQLLNQDNGS